MTRPIGGKDGGAWPSPLLLRARWTVVVLASPFRPPSRCWFSCNVIIVSFCIRKPIARPLAPDVTDLFYNGTAYSLCVHTASKLLGSTLPFSIIIRVTIFHNFPSHECDSLRTSIFHPSLYPRCDQPQIKKNSQTRCRWRWAIFSTEFQAWMRRMTSGAAAPPAILRCGAAKPLRPVLWSLPIITATCYGIH